MTVPLHTRMIAMRLIAADTTGDLDGAAGEVIVDGRLIDLRKRSIVPLGANLRGPGVVHDMGARLRIDAERLVVTGVEPSMRAFPYVPSEQTEGETCDGRMADVQSIVGATLSVGYSSQLSAAIGGPRGCFHIFTLLRLAGPAAVAGLRHPHVQRRLGAGARPGEVLWARCITVDSFKGEGLALEIHGTLTDTFQTGGPPQAGGGSEELAEGLEVMADLSTVFPEMKLDEIAGRRRRLFAGVRNSEPWQAVPAFASLRELSLRKGFSAAVQQKLDDREGLLPESHLVLMMAPVVMQSVAGLLEELDVRPGAGGSVTGTARNSCHMWRADGPLDRMTRPAALSE